MAEKTALVFVSFALILGGSQSRSVTGLLFLLDGESPSPPVEKGLEAQKLLCPEGSAFHNETSKCHKLLEKGPCGNLQLFYSLRDASEFGDCACMTNSEGCTPNLKEGVSNRMILRAPDGKQCYHAFSKGPCKSGEWYVLNDSTHQPECQKNPCCSFSKKLKVASSSENPAALEKLKIKSDYFTFIQNGTCYKTFTQAFCEKGEYAQFFGTADPFPHCYSVEAGPPICLFGVAPQAGMPCDAGYKLVGDDCVMANIDFE